MDGKIERKKRNKNHKKKMMANNNNNENDVIEYEYNGVNGYEEEENFGVSN